MEHVTSALALAAIPYCFRNTAEHMPDCLSSANAKRHRTSSLVNVDAELREELNRRSTSLLVLTKVPMCRAFCLRHLRPKAPTCTAGPEPLETKWHSTNSGFAMCPVFLRGATEHFEKWCGALPSSFPMHERKPSSVNLGLKHVASPRSHFYLPTKPKFLTDCTFVANSRLYRSVTPARRSSHLCVFRSGVCVCHSRQC